VENKTNYPLCLKITVYFLVP